MINLFIYLFNLYYIMILLYNIMILLHWILENKINLSDLLCYQEIYQYLNIKKND